MQRRMPQNMRGNANFRSSLCWLAAFALLLGWVSRGHAAPPKRDPPLLFGGAIAKAKVKVPLDPRLPTGAEIPATGVRPQSSASLCSFRRPVCVHAAAGVAASELSE